MDSIIFDIDGTLWDSTEPVAISWNQALKENSSLNLTVDAEMLSGLFGKTMTEIGNALFPHLDEKKRMALLDKCLEYENRYLENHPGKLYDNVAETLEKLAASYPLFIVSNCQCGYIELLLNSTGLKSYFKDTLCFGQTHVSKGETLLLLMKRNNLSSPIYIGDTQGDADACKAAGIPFIFADYGFGNVADAKTRIHTFSDLETLLLTSNESDRQINILE